MKLNKELLDDSRGSFEATGELLSCWNAKGLYNSMQFVLRLRPDVHDLLDNLPNGVLRASSIGFDKIQAFSTLLHETIHWWQHSGSITGLITSLSYPTQSHKIKGELVKFLKLTGPKKPIINYNSKYATEYLPQGEEFKIINQILNDFYDIEFFRQLTINPHNNIANIAQNPLFENVGHSFHIAYASIIGILGSTFDPDHKFLPDTHKWINNFKRLTDDKIEGYYYGSRISLPPVGIHDIFEGQARFIQIQYLHFASGGALEWDEFDNLGMLSGIYIKAFNVYLHLIDAERPKSINDPLVGLFLLICDISINPADGFPFDIEHFESFVLSADPGTRFFLLCQAVKNNFPEIKSSITNYSASEYRRVSKLLCDNILVHSPLECSETIVNWSKNHDSLREIMEEDVTFTFADINLPIRLLFSRFVRFNEDKLEHPEFFCWTGAWAAGDRCSEDTFKLFKSNPPLFTDKADGDIYPTMLKGKDVKNVTDVFNKFYGWNILYDLTRQWVMGSGQFSYNYFWITSKYSHADLKQWACQLFTSVFGANPDDFEIID